LQGQLLVFVSRGVERTEGGMNTCPRCKVNPPREPSITGRLLCRQCALAAQRRRQGVPPNEATAASIKALAEHLSVLDDDALRQALDRLTPRAELIIRQRLQGRTSIEIGKIFAVSGSRISQLYLRAMMKLLEATHE
jgi:RNA polymerase sigma factor (sigma-70 family)